MKRLVDQESQLEVDSLSHRQPVELPQDWRDMITSTSASDESRCRVLHRLEAPEQTAHMSRLLGDWKESKLCIFNDYVMCLSTFRSDNCEFVSNIHAAVTQLFLINGSMYLLSAYFHNLLIKFN